MSTIGCVRSGIIIDKNNIRYITAFINAINYTKPMHRHSYVCVLSLFVNTPIPCIPIHTTSTLLLFLTLSSAPGITMLSPGTHVFCDCKID